MKEKKVTSYSDTIETRVALLEMCVNNINHTLEKMDAKMDIGFNRLDSEFKDVRKEIGSDFKWLMGMIVGLAAFTVSGFIGLASVMAHGFHWF